MYSPLRPQQPISHTQTHAEVEMRVFTSFDPIITDRRTNEASRVTSPRLKTLTSTSTESTQQYFFSYGPSQQRIEPFVHD